MTVKVDGRSATTNAVGKATTSLPGSKAGTYGVTASSSSYLTATGN